MRRFPIPVPRNLLSLLGAATTTASGGIILTLFLLELVGFEGNPYLGILAYLALPAFFLLGLALIPLGAVVERRRIRRAAARGAPPPRFPVIDLNFDRTRKLVLVFLFLTGVNLVILGAATFKGVEILDSTRFCASTCHVMLPERVAYQRSPHARVPCVSCHIGPGADWFVKSKLSGAWQVVSTNLKLYPRPIPTPIHDLRPARDTCEQCHWPEKFVGERLKVIRHTAEDEANTETKTVLLLHVGGNPGHGPGGIHWHVDPSVHIRYRSDPSRETIHEVELSVAGAPSKTFLGSAGGEEPAPESEWREMDCVDCHNRPTHIYRSPEEELDLAFARGRLDRGLPHLRQESVRLLAAAYSSHDEARRGLGEGLERFYRENHPELYATARDRVQAAAREIGEIYCANVFPTMNVTWGTYPNHIGHQGSPGCFRCHGGDHATADGETISADCETCHALLAMEEEAPAIEKLLRP